MPANTQLSIGTDPELILVEGDRLVRAGDVIRERESKFGVDGHPFTAELRPSPAIYPRDLVASVRATLGSRSEQLKNYKWFAGPWAYEKPLGGHIHFGTPFVERYRDALDYQFGPVLALSEPENLARSRRSTIFYGDHPYGQLGDVRTKAWGFEYRTPSSFIVSPGVALGTLSIAKAIIWEEMQKGSQAFSNLSKTTRDSLVFSAADFHNCKRQVFENKLDEITSQLTKMIYFQKGQEGRALWPTVSYLLRQVVLKGGYNSNQDIKVKWKLCAESSEPIKSPPKEPPNYWREFAERHGRWWLGTNNQPQFVIQQEGTFNPIPTPTTAQLGRIAPDIFWERLGD